MKLFTAVIFLFVSIGGFAQDIKIDNISKTYSFAGDKVIISGSGFDTNARNLKVMFGAVEARILTSTNYQIEAQVPIGATNSTVEVANLVTRKSARSNKFFFPAFGGSNFDPALLTSITEMRTENGVYDLCLCDFNNDGKTDIATANRDSEDINIFPNTSTTLGQVQYGTPITIDVEGKTLNIKCADLNSDGKSDVILSRNSENEVFVLRNTTTSGTIQFAPKATLLSSNDDLRRIEVADINLDGKPEIIASNSSPSDEIDIFVNTSTSGNISFQTNPIAISVNGLGLSSGLRVTDLNNDSYPEIVTTPFLGNKIYLLENQSSGNTFSFKAPQVINATSNITNIEIGNLDGDDVPDLVVANNFNPNVSIFKNNTENQGTVNLGSEVRVDIGAGNTGKWGLDLGDINGDGFLDIAVSNINQKLITVLINRTLGTDGNFDFNVHNINVNEKQQNLKIGDVNGDAKPDIIYAGIDNDYIALLTNKHCLIPKIFGETSRTVCKDSEVTLRTSGGPQTYFAWFKNDGNTEWEVKNSTEPFYNETFASAGNFTYRVQATQGGCTEWSEYVTVNVIDGSIAALTGIAPIAPICEGNDIVLQAQGSLSSLPAGTTFEWKAPDNSVISTTTPTLTISGSSVSDAGEYYVEIHSGPCVSNIVSTTVNIVPTADIDITSSGDLDFCIGGFTTLSVPQVTTNTYQWYKNSNPITAGGNSHKIDITESGIYNVTIETQETCVINTSLVTVEVYSPPTALFSASTTGCTTEAISFGNASTVNSNIATTYAWDFGDGQSSSEENPTHAYAQEGLYTVKLIVSYDATCRDEFEQQITISTATPISITADGPLEFCQGEQVVLSAPEGLESYLWNDANASTTRSIAVTESGFYSVEVTNANNCTTTDETEVVVFENPEINIEINTSNGQIQLIASGATRYEWQESNTLQGNDSSDPIVNPEITTTYMVTGYDANNCEGTAEITVEVNPSDAIGKVFTPNNDGENDFWSIKNVQQFSNCTIVVFNRSGQVVFEQKNYNNNWDGTFNGKELNEGVYYYVLKCDDSATASITGSVTILR